MTKRYLRLAAWFTFSLVLHGAAQAEPWIVHAQTPIPSNTAISNPTPFVLGVAGEQSALPFVVPAGHELVLRCWGIEGYDQPGIAGILPWLGVGPALTSKALPTVAASNGSNAHCGTEWRLPAGTIVNVQVTNAQAAPATYSWHMSGELVAVE